MRKSVFRNEISDTETREMKLGSKYNLFDTPQFKMQTDLLK